MQSTHSDAAYWLAALQLEGVGPVRLRRWLAHYGSLSQLFVAKTIELQAAGFTLSQISAVKQPNWPLVEKNLLWCEKNNCHLLSCIDEKYPLLLNEVSDAPVMLFVRGNLDLLSQPQLAMVGTRNPTIIGAESAEQFAYYLATAGLVITSGLALGVDAASHRGALAASGKTIAVCGAGLQHIYPRAHTKLAEEIIATGALVSEFLPLIPPKAKHFPMRNRVISGLSLGVLVVEAALRSGSLITARCAIEQGREVFALPGSIHNPLARGCHQLLRVGAKLVETAEDVVEELGSLHAVSTSKTLVAPRLSPEKEHILHQIGYESTALDVIIMRSGQSSSDVSSVLLYLELEGYITTVSGGYVRQGR